MSTAENLSPVPSPSILSGDAAGSPVPTFEEKKTKRKTTSRRKTAKRKSSRRKVASSETTEAPPPKRSTRRKTSKRKTKGRRKTAGRRAAAAPVGDVSIEAVIQAKQAELAALDKRGKLLQKQLAALEKML